MLLNRSTLFQDGLLNIDNHYFDQMVSLIYHTEFQFKANSFDTEALFLDLSIIEWHSFI